ncbi:MAG: DUF1553 domain-containing protein, partial [Chitinophagaceae bacterium]
MLLAGIFLGMNACNLFTPAVNYNTDIKPLINKKCISCHGGVRAKSGFSLLFREEALAPAKSGKPAIIPGDPDHSELIRRITASDPEDRMPYKHEPLTEEEIQLFRNWIRQGAKWGEHWAYLPVNKVEIPGATTKWGRNEIDQFVFAGLEEQDLTPSPDADPLALLRRLSLDLIGMPAPEAAVQFFKDQPSDANYEQLVDRLLQSPDYGEKWAPMWLDLARYADTRGYEADRGRMIWKYRDWVINAFNRDMPYDQFLREQFAGDLVANPSDDQYIATAFHRNSMTNDEGGTDNEEFRVAAVMDRVNTTWTGILGTTFNCVQCHSHPYDPFRHEEYYQFLSYFNNTRDEDTEAEYPLLRQYDSAVQGRLQSVIAWVQQQQGEQAARETSTFLKTWQPSVNSLQCDQYVNAALVSSWYATLRQGGSCRLPNYPLQGKEDLLFRFITYKTGGIWKVYLDSLGGQPLFTVTLPNTKGNWQIEQISIPPVQGNHDLFFSFENSRIKDRNENGVLFEWFRSSTPFPGKGRPGYDSALSRFHQVLNAPAETTPILFENPNTYRRSTAVFERGNWLLKGKTVQPRLPAIFQQSIEANTSGRIQLANWLTHPKNPLTARVWVNRIWEQLFGTGIVESLEDFGSQGMLPSHPGLLDWLAYTFMVEDHWSTKKLIRRIVLSSTYRQRSTLTPQLQEKDPANKWYARGPRFRLSAEQIRDQALAISGALCSKKYGPGVMPYQPSGIWSSPYNGASWKQSEGQDQYRRAVYIYWKRSAAYPSTITFDAPGRQFCVARRVRTNTPLQALTLLNDPTYLDLARKFTERILREGGTQPNQQIQKAYRLATGREASAKVFQTLYQLYQRSLEQYRADRKLACDMIGALSVADEPATAALV